MEKHRKVSIYERVQSDFGVNVFRRYYYCSGLSQENLKRKLKIRHGQECRILERFDHIVVESEGEIIVYLLVSHNSVDCCKGKYPCVNVIDESINKLFETCSSEEKQNNLQIVNMYNNLYASVYTKFSRDSLKCASCGLH